MIRIKRRDIFDAVILIFLFAHVLILRWLGLPARCSEILLVLIIINLLFHFRTQLNQFYFWFAILIFAYPFISRLLQGGTFRIAYRNTFGVTLSLLVILYISYLIKYKRDFLSSFLMKSCPLLNVYIIINIPIIYLQSQGYYGLSGVSESVNTFKPDMMSGLFGFNGTPFLAMFMTFLILLNFCYFSQIKRRSRRGAFLLYNIFLLAYALILPLYNDNKGFYVELGIAFVLLFLYGIISSNNTRTLRGVRNVVVRILVMIVAIAVVLYFTIRFTKFGDVINLMITKMISGARLTNNSIGSGERIGMIFYALRNPSLRWTGFGLARIRWTEQNAFGFVHFGQSDCGVFLILGGMIYLLLILIFIFLITKKHVKSVLMSLLITVFFLVTMIYTQLFTVTTLMISTTLIWAVLILFNEKVLWRKSGSIKH